MKPALVQVQILTADGKDCDKVETVPSHTLKYLHQLICPLLMCRRRRARGLTHNDINIFLRDNCIKCGTRWVVKVGCVNSAQC